MVTFSPIHPNQLSQDGISDWYFTISQFVSSPKDKKNGLEAFRVSRYASALASMRETISVATNLMVDCKSRGKCGAVIGCGLTMFNLVHVQNGFPEKQSLITKNKGQMKFIAPH